MPRFMITYLGSPQPDSPEEGQKHMHAYKQWLTDLGDAVESAANPVKNPQTISADGSVEDISTTGMSGFTIIRAETPERALKATSACPYLAIGGTLELAELMEMPM